MAQRDGIAKINIAGPTAYEWAYLCHYLCLDLSSIQYGYCKELHAINIWNNIKAATCKLRMTPSLEKLVVIMHDSEEQSRENDLNYYRGDLRQRLSVDS